MSQALSMYSVTFNEESTFWMNNRDYNLCFLKIQQNYANDLLKNRTYLFLNEVYLMLGIRMKDFGEFVGWIYDEKNLIGDNFVDFGINEHNSKGNNPNIVLDFNVDGYIMDKYRYKMLKRCFGED